MRSRSFWSTLVCWSLALVGFIAACTDDAVDFDSNDSGVVDGAPSIGEGDSSSGSNTSSSGTIGDAAPDAIADGSTDRNDATVDASPDATTVCTNVSCAIDVTCTAGGCGTCNMATGYCRNP